MKKIGLFLALVLVALISSCLRSKPTPTHSAQIAFFSKLEIEASENHGHAEIKFVAGPGTSIYSRGYGDSASTGDTVTAKDGSRTVVTFILSERKINPQDVNVRILTDGRSPSGHWEINGIKIPAQFTGIWLP